MNDKQQQPEQTPGADKNPTLNQPGSQVADYGNVTGGSGNEDLEKEHGMNSARQGNSSIPLDGEDTIGNP